MNEALGAIRVHVVGNRRSPESDRVFEHVVQGFSKTLKFMQGQISSPHSWANSRAKKSLVGINVSHTGKQRLVQQCSFYRQLSSAEQFCERFLLDCERRG